MEILRVENLSKFYGTGEAQVNALNGVSFSVRQGEFVAIIGPSGSGKSTLLHMVGGVDIPSAGKVYIDGTDIYSLKEDALAIFRRRQIGLVYQFYNLLPVLNVEENLSLPMLLDGRKVDKTQLDAMTRALGLEQRLKHLPSQLSGGQQQKVGIGRALLPSPAIVLADEPTGNLDSKSGGEIISLLRQLHDERRQTLIIITHDESIALTADRIIALEDGLIVKDEVIRQ
ncbi:MAG: ABC transporter ATP-binding protein [Ruminococcaceae bacterium]|nr:ABC transporter ATP-binding protein [Oscillospiraceae bacterium]